mmetsp:Transcript_32642/g.56832  ORF Transcript_32642/g.56832 Transcript_32642/m.56832 type:complete len:119 (-) Transcript_32642:320-676(-)
MSTIIHLLQALIDCFKHPTFIFTLDSCFDHSYRFVRLNANKLLPSEKEYSNDSYTQSRIFELCLLSLLSVMMLLSILFSELFKGHCSPCFNAEFIDIEIKHQTVGFERMPTPVDCGTE